MPWVSLLFVVVVFPDHTHLLFLVEGLIYRNLLCYISCLGICLVLSDVHILTDSKLLDDAPGFGFDNLVAG